ncbi:hypothetical protein ACFODZ_16365 [Marinicella sediminis]|uniref:Uncharacterized protein n=1 Tax=Marinicella sediminis TaxID=1792834 RepID=A0ABV7JCH6_9GAMM|nr:hypothetical protein [Marinicella sediminis]
MSQPVLITAIVVVFMILFPLFWWVITRLLKKASGMNQEVNITSLGKLIIKHGLGSGRINGINHNHCLTLSQYEGGYVFSTAAIMGGGQLIVRHDELVSVVSKKSCWFFNKVIIKTTFGSKITIYGRLTKAFADSAIQS